MSDQPAVKALQTAAISTGLPFAIILLIMCYSLYKGLQEEYVEMQQLSRRQQKESYRQILSGLVNKRQAKAKQETDEVKDQ